MRGRSKAISKAPKQRKRSATARPTGPAVNPSSIELALLLYMSRPNSSECEESRKRLAALESEIASHSAKVALERLLAAGCDRGSLLRASGFLGENPSILFLIIGLQRPGRSPLRCCSA